MYIVAQTTESILSFKVNVEVDGVFLNCLFIGTCIYAHSIIVIIKQSRTILVAQRISMQSCYYSGSSYLLGMSHTHIFLPGKGPAADLFQRE